MKHDLKPPCMTVKQIAERWSLSPNTVYAMIDRGEIPVLKFGTSLRVRPEDVDAYENSCLITASQGQPPTKREAQSDEITAGVKKRRVARQIKKRL